MRVLLCFVISLLLLSPTLQAQSPDLEIPAEYKGFFDDFTAVMKKHPAAASRFGLFDRKPPNSTPVIRSAFCSGSNQCCTKYVDEGGPFLRCVECSFCPK